MNLQKFDIYYIVGLAITSVIMLLILIFGVNSLSIVFLIFFWVVKFLSGFGLILGITNGFMFLLNKTKDKLSKRGTTALLIFQILVPILFIIYALYKVFSSYASSATTTSMTDLYALFDTIIYIYGIASLLLQLYIIPILTKKFDESINMGRNQKWGRSIKNAGRNIKKQVLRWKKEDAKIQYLDQKSIKELLDNWRNRFAVILLIPLAIGSLIFTPISFILIVMWGKIIIWNKAKINTYEKIGILISIIVIGLIAILAPYVDLGIYSRIATYLWSINIFYFFGILLATLIFIVKLLSLQGVSIGSYRKNRQKEKVDDMKSEIKDLKKRESAIRKRDTE